jgi:hypothetical protein
VTDTPKKSLRDEITHRRGPKGLGLTEQEKVERNKKQAQAAALAGSVLKSRHKAEYDALYQQAKEEMGVA